MKKSNLLHFRTNRREQPSRKQKRKIITLPAKSELSRRNVGIFITLDDRFQLAICEIPPDKLKDFCKFMGTISAR